MWLDPPEPQHNQSVRRGIAIREGLLKGGEADYLLFGDAKALGTVEAKPEGQAIGFFNKNVVSEYAHGRRRRAGRQGRERPLRRLRHKETRKLRWEKLMCRSALGY